LLLLLLWPLLHRLLPGADLVRHCQQRQHLAMYLCQVAGTDVQVLVTGQLQSPAGQVIQAAQAVEQLRGMQVAALFWGHASQPPCQVTPGSSKDLDGVDAQPLQRR
jgi:hypothetical protein